MIVAETGRRSYEHMNPDRIDRSSVNSSKISETISWLERERKNGSSKTVEQDQWLRSSEMSGSLKGFIRDNGKALSKGKLVLVSVKDIRNKMHLACPDPGPSRGISEEEVNDDGRTKVGFDGNGPDSDQNDLIALLRSSTPIDGKIVEMDVKGKDGPTYLMVSCLPLPLKEGSPAEMLILTMDVTEMRGELDSIRRSMMENDFALERAKKELEAAASRSELLQVLNELLGGLMDAGTFILDIATGRIMGSEMFNSLLGLQKGERSDMGSFLEGVHAEDKGKVRSFLLGQHDERKLHQISLRYLHNGKGAENVLSIRATFAGLKKSTGTVLGVVMDLTTSVTDSGLTQGCIKEDVPDQSSIFERERRMIELKEEVNVLMRELGRPEKYTSYRV
ncbi:MAG: hypothetical protein MUC62_05115 [Candidatus Thermoplasmatota archaeon]|jgi:hypothetical protein|nr:hypothetical protein [Candidatus Thermoplasmatota archaeon]